MQVDMHVPTVLVLLCVANSERIRPPEGSPLHPMYDHPEGKTGAARGESSEGRFGRASAGLKIEMAVVGAEKERMTERTVKSRDVVDS